MQYPEDALTSSTITQTTKLTSVLYLVHNRKRTAWELHNDATMMVMRRGLSSQPDNSTPNDNQDCGGRVGDNNASNRAAEAGKLDFRRLSNTWAAAMGGFFSRATC